MKGFLEFEEKCIYCRKPRKNAMKMFKTASLWHPQLTFIAYRIILRISLWSPDVFSDIVFASSKQPNLLFFRSVFYPFKTVVILSCETLDLVYENSTEGRYSSMITCAVSSVVAKSMPMIIFVCNPCSFVRVNYCFWHY